MTTEAEILGRRTCGVPLDGEDELRVGAQVVAVVAGALGRRPRGVRDTAVREERRVPVQEDRVEVPG